MTNYTLPPDLDEKFRRLGDDVKVAAASEKLAALGRFCDGAAAMVGPRLPLQEAIDRIQAFVEAIGLVVEYGDDAVQAVLANAFVTPGVVPGFEDDAEEERAPEFSDEALALSFAEQHASSLRYIAAQGRWYRWLGTHWIIDDTLHVLNQVRRHNRLKANSCPKEKSAVAIASSKTIAGVERTISTSIRGY
jgi:hypothetical protein